MEWQELEELFGREIWELQTPRHDIILVKESDGSFVYLIDPTDEELEEDGISLPATDLADAKVDAAAHVIRHFEHEKLWIQESIDFLKKQLMKLSTEA